MFLPLSQRSPLNPGGQIHKPVRVLHMPPCSQTGQALVQSGGSTDLLDILRRGRIKMKDCKISPVKVCDILEKKGPIITPKLN